MPGEGGGFESAGACVGARVSFVSSAMVGVVLVCVVSLATPRESAGVSDSLGGGGGGSLGAGSSVVALCSRSASLPTASFRALSGMLAFGMIFSTAISTSATVSGGVDSSMGFSDVSDPDLLVCGAGGRAASGGSAGGRGAVSASSFSSSGLAGPGNDRGLRAFMAIDTEIDVAVVSLALDPLRLGAAGLRRERVVGFCSSATSLRASSASGTFVAGAASISTSSAGAAAASARGDATAPAAPRGLRDRLGGLGYVPSASSSLRFRFVPPPERRLRGLAARAWSSPVFRAPFVMSFAAAGSSSSPASRSRSFAGGRRARDEARRDVSPSCTRTSLSSMLIGFGSPNSAGSSSGSERASPPRGWYSGNGGPLNRPLSVYCSSSLCFFEVDAF